MSPAPAKPAGPEKIKVIICEDQPQILKNQLKIFQDSPEVEVIGTALSGEATLELLEKKQPDSWELPHTQNLLGAALAGRKKHAEADPLLLAGYKGLKVREQALPAPSRKRLLTGALERLVQFYEASGQPRKAAEWRHKLEKEKEAQNQLGP